MFWYSVVGSLQFRTHLYCNVSSDMDDDLSGAVTVLQDQITTGSLDPDGLCTDVIILRHKKTGLGHDVVEFKGSSYCQEKYNRKLDLVHSGIVS